jgi:DNA-binding NarL/FixJ family response regulator
MIRPTSELRRQSCSRQDDAACRSCRRAWRHTGRRTHDPAGRDPLRVVVADDVLLTREGLARLLQDAGIDVVRQAEDAEGLLRKVRLDRPDVAIVDIRMPPTHTDEGLVAAQSIRADHPELGVLVLSQYVEPSHVMRLVEQHPERVGYLPSGSSTSQPLLMRCGASLMAKR